MNRVYRAVLFIAVLFVGGFLWLKFRPAPVTKLATTVVSAPSPTPSPTPQPTPEPTPLPQPISATEQVSEPAGPRTWTSNDGRTLKAEFLAATSTSVTVRRDDRTVFTIPLNRLSADDVAWIGQQPKTGLVAPTEPDPIPSPASAAQVAAAPKVPAVTQKQLDQLLARFPNAPSLSGEVTNDLQQLHVKYRDMVKFIRPNSVGATIKMIRTKILDDIKVLSTIAGTSSGDWTGKRGSSQSAAAENGILSARRSVSWLQGPLSTYINNYDAFVVE